MTVVRSTLHTSDGVALEAEVARPDGAPRAAWVLCHPHPQFGGTMRSIVISALFDALPRAGVACLRFNFRGVEGSTGTFDEGAGERLDAMAAVDALHALVPDAPLVLAGWSFGGDVALSVAAEIVQTWFAIAPPLHYVTEEHSVADDPRPKHLVLAEHDEIRAPDVVRQMVVDWAATDVQVVGGASHFFVGRTDRVVELARALVDEVSATP